MNSWEGFGFESPDEHFRDLNKTLNSLRIQDKFLDLHFVCHNTDGSTPAIVISAHQFVFRSLSTVLKDLFRIGQQKQPYEQIVISLDSVDPVVLEKLIEYLYEGKTLVNYEEHYKLVDLCNLLNLDVPIRHLDLTMNGASDNVLRESGDICQVINSFTYVNVEDYYNIDRCEPSHFTNEHFPFTSKCETFNLENDLATDEANATQIAGNESIHQNTEELLIFKTEDTPHTNLQWHQWYDKLWYKTCNQCEYSTDELSKLKRHKELCHEDMKPFKYEKYQGAKEEIVEVKRRKQVLHDMIKKYKCGKCNYYASRKGALNRHTKSVHDKNKNYKCLECPYATSRKYVLLRHKRNVHSKVNNKLKEPYSQANTKKESDIVSGDPKINATEKVYCVCRKGGNGNQRQMIGCDFCEEWFHPECLSLTSEEVNMLAKIKWQCPVCECQAEIGTL